MRRNMKRLVYLGSLCLAGVHGWGQISDAQAVQLAGTYASRIGAGLRARNPQVSRREGWIYVFLDPTIDVQVTMENDGTFVSYTDFRRKEPEPGPGRYPTDAEAWRAAEALIARFDPPQGLVRDEIKRQNETVPVIYCFFNERPYGYRSEAGNTSVCFQKSDGAVLSLIVSKGWSYEPPNIRISEAEAKAIACQRMGGAPPDWDYRISYMAGSSPSFPEGIRRLAAQRIARLVYWMVNRTNRDGIIIDTVTGDVLTEMRVGHRGTETGGIGSVGAADVPQPARDASGQASSASPWLNRLLIIIGLVAVLVGVGYALIWKRRAG